MYTSYIIFYCIERFNNVHFQASLLLIYTQTILYATHSPIPYSSSPANNLLNQDIAIDVLANVQYFKWKSITEANIGVLWTPTKMKVKAKEKQNRNFYSLNIRCINGGHN